MTKPHFFVCLCLLPFMIMDVKQSDFEILTNDRLSRIGS